jgi:hypothetical protein
MTAARDEMARNLSNQSKQAEAEKASEVVCCKLVCRSHMSLHLMLPVCSTTRNSHLNRVAPSSAPNDKPRSGDRLAKYGWPWEECHGFANRVPHRRGAAMEYCFGRGALTFDSFPDLNARWINGRATINTWNRLCMQQKFSVESSVADEGCMFSRSIPPATPSGATRRQRICDVTADEKRSLSVQLHGFHAPQYCINTCFFVRNTSPG